MNEQSIVELEQKTSMSEEENLIVFSFEPNPESVKAILDGTGKRNPGHGDCLDPIFINDKVFIIPCALGQEEKIVQLYSTSKDCGCSSLFQPVTFQVDKVIDTHCFTLKSFFDLFPFDKFPLIEYIKVDAQGSDLDIIKSGGDYIQKHVAIITIEAENNQYRGTTNSLRDIVKYMNSQGFSLIKNSDKSKDPTFVNEKFKHMDIYYKQI